MKIQVKSMVLLASILSITGVVGCGNSEIFQGDLIISSEKPSVLGDFSIKSISSGVEFNANTITSGTQTQPSVAIENNGESFVIAWATNHEVDGYYNVYARRFGVDLSDGTIDDTIDNSEFKINNDQGSYNYSNPEVAMKPNGEKFAVVWERHLASGIEVKAFDNNTGSAVGIQMAPSGTSTLYRTPDITFNNNYFAVVWSQSRSTTPPYNYDIYSRIGQVTDDPTPTVGLLGSSATRVHADNMFVREETLPAVTTKNATGGNASDFNTTWMRDNSVIEFISGFNPSGSPSIITTNSQRPAIASPYNSADYLLSWRNNSLTDILATRFDGSTNYSSSVINQTTAGFQDWSAVAMSEDYMVVVWHGPGVDGTEVYARLYEVDSGNFGVALTNEFRVNDHTDGYQESPSVAMDEHGNFVVAWYSVIDGSPEISAKRYNIDDLI